MGQKTIATHAELVLQLAELRMQKGIQEDNLKNSFKDIVSGLNLLSIFSDTSNQNRPLGLAKMGVNMVLDLIIGLTMGKNRSVKGYLSAVILERFTSMIVDNNLLNIISGIRSLFSRKSQYEKSQEF